MALSVSRVKILSKLTRFCVLMVHTHQEPTPLIHGTFTHTNTDRYIFNLTSKGPTTRWSISISRATVRLLECSIGYGAIASRLMWKLLSPGKKLYEHEKQNTMQLIYLNGMTFRDASLVHSSLSHDLSPPKCIIHVKIVNLYNKI